MLTGLPTIGEVVLLLSGTYNAIDVVVIGVLVALFILWFRRLPEFWHGERKSPWDPDETPGSWPYGAALWGGFVRLTPISGALIGVIAVLFAALRAGNAAWLLSIQIVFSVLFMLALGAAVTIVLFNRPSWAVVPHLRDRPGALSEWRSGWRAMRAGRRRRRGP